MRFEPVGAQRFLLPSSVSAGDRYFGSRAVLERHLHLPGPVRMHPYDNPLKIPKIEKSVTLWTHPDGLVLGSIFLHLGEPERPHAEDPWSVLNDHEDFLVVRRHDPEELRFYNKACLIRMEYEEDGLFAEASSRELPCRVHMMDGSMLEGAMRKSLPPERSRLYDYMNADNRRFLKLYFHERSVCLVNKSYVAYIMTSDAAAD